MQSHATLLYVLLGLSILTLVPLVARPSLMFDRAGKVFAFFAIVALPLLVAIMGLGEHVDRSKTVAFCTSCHVMERYGQSLHIDDVEHVPAKHFQYGRVPKETACFSCHTTYTMYGDFAAKLRGLRHVWVQYLGHVPDKPKLYSPYNNRECLHCHENARSFVEAVPHKNEPGIMESILANKKSCIESGCHGVTHTVDDLPKLSMWPAKAEDKK